MQTQSAASRARAQGFSLIEILIVLVVLAIIMAMAVGAVMGARHKAKQGATVADMRSLATAIEAYSVDQGFPPASGAFDVVADVLRPYHNKLVPVNDHWGHIYTYVRNVGSYTLTSFGRDGVDGLEMTPTTRSDYDRDIEVVDGKFPGLP